jgi:hypothetical protein
MVPCTISRLAMLGRMCSAEIRARPLPATRAASMKSRVQSDSAAPRVSRANTGMLKMPMAMMALIAPGPKTAVIMIAIRSEGKAKTRSLPRMMISSIRPPMRGGIKPQRHAERHADADRDEGHGDGGACADHDHGKHVAAEMIRSERVLGDGRLELVGDVELVGSNGVQRKETSAKPRTTPRAQSPVTNRRMAKAPCAGSCGRAERAHRGASSRGSAAA